jgi:Protein of unknown function (DUF2892).
MKNVSTFDAKVRYVLGLGLLIYGGLAFLLELPMFTTAAILGAALIITARLRLCGLYKLIGINTCPLEER